MKKYEKYELFVSKIQDVCNIIDIDNNRDYDYILSNCSSTLYRAIRNLERSIRTLRAEENFIKTNDFKTCSLDALELSMRVENCLYSFHGKDYVISNRPNMPQQIYYISDLIQFSAEELKRLPHIGKHAIDEIINCLAYHGLQLTIHKL